VKDNEQHFIDYPETTVQHCTRWDMASHEYIYRHGIVILRLLNIFRDKSRDHPERPITFLSRNQAYRIAHESSEEQREVLKRDYRDALLRAIEQYEPKYGDCILNEDSKPSEKMGARLLTDCKALLAEKLKRNRTRPRSARS
jgi:hypothetical protein